MALDEGAQSLPSKSPAERQYGTLVDTYGNEFQVPNFTIKELRSAIPPHCFERSALHGFAYIVRDILLLASTFYMFYYCVTPNNIPSTISRLFPWTIYTFV